jgi:osmoprotectant transport system permease protein
MTAVTGLLVGAVVVLGVLGDFGDAIDFILHSRESVTGGAQVGGSQLWEFTWEQIKISAVAVGIACAVSIPIGLALGHWGRGGLVATNISNVGRAVPPLAVIAFFVAYIGVGFWNVVLALTLLAIPPILANTYVGMIQVDRGTVDAARGMGFSEFRIVRAVELPLALPTLFGGIRTSVVNVIATATIAPLAGVLTLGDPIINASVYGDAGRLGASILVALLAVAAELLFAGLQRALTPRGIKLAAARDRGQRRTRLHPRRAMQTGGIQGA